MQNTGLRTRSLLMLVYLTIIASIFVLDLFEPLIFSVWPLYILPLFISRFHVGRPFSLLLALFSTLFIAVAFFGSPVQESASYDLINHVVGCAILWFIAGWRIGLEAGEKPVSSAPDYHDWAVVRIVLAYLIVGGVWILVSDMMLASLVDDTKTFVGLSQAKGWVYVIFTGTLLYVLLQRYATSRRNVENELRRNRERLHQITEATPAHILEIDREGRVAFTNRTNNDDAPFNRLGSTFAGWFPEHQQDSFQQVINEVFATGSSHTLDMELVNPEGAFRTYSATFTPLRTITGVDRVIVTASDITPRKKIEDALKKSEESYRLLFSNSLDAVLLTSPDGRIRGANQAACDLFGYTLEELKRSGRKTILDESDVIVVDALNQRRATGRFKGELTFITKRGTRIACEVSTSEFPETSGEVRASWFIRDITERRRLEDAVHESEQRLRLALSAANQGLFDLDVVTGEAVVNDNYATMLGYDPLEFKETNARWIERLHPDDHERAKEIYTSYVAGKIPEYKLDFRQRTKSGEWKWILSVGKIVERDADGKPLRMLGTHVDITDRKANEENLVKLNRIYSLISQVNQAIVKATTREELYADVCDIAIRFGKFRMAWIGMADEQTHSVVPLAHAGENGGYLDAITITVDDKPEGAGPTGRAIRFGQYQLSNDIENDSQMAPWRDEALRRGFRSSIALPITLAKRPVGALNIYASESHFFTHEEIDLLENVATDISFAVEKLEQEEERRKAEQRVRFQASLLDAVGQAVIATTLDGTIIYWNRAAENLYGWHADEVLGRNVLEITPTESSRNNASEILESLAQGESWSGEFVVRRRDGTTFPAMVSDSPIYDQNGILIGIIGVSVDITERKQVIEELEHSNERFQLLAKATNDAIWDWNVQSNEIWWNETFYKQYGYKQDAVFTIERWVDTVHPDDRERVKASFFSALNHPVDTWSEEYRFLHANGSYGYVVDRGFLVRNADGKPVRMIGSMLDITSLKLAELDQRFLAEERSKLLKQLQLQFERMPFGYVLLNDQFRITEWNPSCEKIFGFSRPEVIGKHPYHLVIPPSAQEFVANFVEQLKNSDRTVSAINENMTKDGRTILCEWFDTPLRDENGNYAGLMAMVQDVTERKRAEEELVRSNKQLRQLSAHLQSIREEEQKRISLEIHDELGQQLTAMKIEASLLEKAALRVDKKIESSPLLEHTHALENIIDTAIGTVRRIATELRPGVLDRLGPVEALEWQAQEFQKRTGIACTFESRVSPQNVGENVATALFRIFQETLTNVARHSQASNVRATLSEKDGFMELQVVDNGRGISVEEIANTSSLGLLGISERVHMLGGAASIRGTAGKGTTVIVRLPLTTTST